MQDTDSTDLNKIDTIQPTPKRLCTRTLKGCLYCKFDAPHPSTTLLYWSSEDWDAKKAKAKEQRSFIDFKLLEQQLQNALQDTTGHNKGHNTGCSVRQTRDGLN